MKPGPAALPADRIKVAILGGGCGGLAAAWSLTATPELRERFEVTVHQRGWQLGGKGASGRMAQDGNSQAGHRIEEHGLHIWFGFYAHAFRMLRQAYQESELATGEDWWRTPFQKCHSISLYDRRDDGSWVKQAVTLPARGGNGSGPPTEPRRRPLPWALARVTRLVALELQAELRSEEPRRRGRLRGSAVLAGTGASRLEQLTAEPVVERLLELAKELGEELAGLELPDSMRLWRGVIDMVAATLTGIVRDGLLWRGLSAIDGEDLRAWLGRHGASPKTLERTPVLRGLYDLTFAYRGGDKRRPSLAAGKGLQSLLMMIDYEGAFMWRMRAGMGDVVFSPMYLALRDRGVQFRFFSRVDALRLVPDRPSVEAIELTREVTVAAGVDAYDPIKKIGDWWCWPAQPDRDQFAARSHPESETLRRGVDFDDVVLAIPVGALPSICEELAAASPRFKRMLDGAGTVRTKALQVWLTKPVHELRGVPSGEVQLDPPATAYAEPFDTYCDMSHLLAAEGCGEGGPRGIAYFCAVLSDDVPGDGCLQAVRTAALRHLEEHARAFWPGAFEGGEFDWGVLWDPEGRPGQERLDAQYIRANVDASDRYVTTSAGSVNSRLAPDESGFQNLVLAGDWTHNDIDGGCVEAAVISGERAGRALIAADTARRRRRGSRRLVRRTGGRSRASTGLIESMPKRSAGLPPYVEYGALATAPGPLECERARIYCFFVRADRARVQQLCDRVFRTPSGGALRYHVPAAAPVILTFGVLGGLRSQHPLHAGHGSALESEAAIWIPTVAQRWDAGAYLSDHLAIFMPYIWVDDPVAFASGREVYGFPKTQGWMRNLGDPRSGAGSGVAPDPPEELHLDVYGTRDYAPSAVLGRQRLLTVRHTGGAAGYAGGGGAFSRAAAQVAELAALLDPFRPGGVERRLAGVRAMAGGVRELMAEQVVHHVFLKQVRDVADGEQAALQQVVEARSSVTPRSLRWRRLSGAYELAVEPLDSQPLYDDLGLEPTQTTRLAFAAEFGFRMEPGEVVWPRP